MDKKCPVLKSSSTQAIFKQQFQFKYQWISLSNTIPTASITFSVIGSEVIKANVRKA